MINKVSYPMQINWILYKQHCWRTGEVEGNFKTLRNYMKGRC